MSRGDFAGQLELYYIGCLGAFRSLFGIKADWVTFGKGLKSVALNGRIVDKYVTAVFAGDKSKPLGFIEPFYCSISHFFPPSL